MTKLLIIDGVVHEAVEVTMLGDKNPQYLPVRKVAWCTEPPVEPGWYWFWNAIDLKVVYVTYEGEQVGVRHGDRFYPLTGSTVGILWRWLGPLPAPPQP
jgi:hypothetical protein